MKRVFLISAVIAALTILAGEKVCASAAAKASRSTEICRAAEQSADSTMRAVLAARLEEYFAALERESIPVKCQESDFIISTCKDSLVRQAAAVMTYNHFLGSKVMGDEAVAIHIFDKWFSDGTVKMYNEADWWSAKFFAQINRSSLIGSKAPRLSLFSPEGVPVTLFDDGAGAKEGSSATPTVLFFYDTGCAKCKVESILLKRLLESGDFSVRFCAIYIGSNKEKWEEFRRTDLNFHSPSSSVLHLWDPDMNEEIIMKYGVIQTPRLFLVDENRTVLGRGLDTDALEQLLKSISRKVTLEYGSDEAMEMFKKTFSAMEEDMGCDAVSRVASHISRRTLEAGDTLLFKQMTGDLLYYLIGLRGEVYKCGTDRFLPQFILSRSDIWNSADDSLQVVELANLMRDLDSLCPLGEKMPDLTVPATVITPGAKKEKKKNINLQSCRKAVVIFHTDGCPVCRDEIAGAKAMMASRLRLPETPRDYPLQRHGKEIRPRSAVLVDMDEIWNSNPSLAEALMSGFDMSALPFILATDSKAIVYRKWLTLKY